MKRLLQKKLSLVLALAALLVLPALTACTARAEAGPSAAFDVDVTGIIPPEIWAMPNYSPVISVGSAASDCVSDDSYTGGGWINGVLWMDMTTEMPLEWDDMFRPGRVYCVLVLMKPAAEGQKLFEGEEDIPFTPRVNGQSAVWIKFSEISAAVCYVFPALPSTAPVPWAEITGIDVPVPDASPDYEAAMNSEGCFLGDETGGAWLNGVSWWDVTANRAMYPGQLFEKGHVYRVSVSVAAREEFTFCDDAGAVVSRVTIDGFDAKVETASAKAITVSIEFEPAWHHITQISVLNIEPPKSGLTPDYSGTIITGDFLSPANCSFENNSLGAWRGGVCWTDVTEGEAALSPEEHFKLNRRYKVTVSLVAHDGFRFSDESGIPYFTILINGETAALEMVTPESIRASREYVAEAPNLNIPIIRDVDAPVAGNGPNYFADVWRGAVRHSISDSETGMVSGILWFDETEHASVKPGTFFQPGHQYSVRVLVRVADERVFYDENGDLVLRAWFNDQILYGSRYDDEGTIAFTYTYPALPGGSEPSATLIDRVALRVEAPAEGRNPAPGVMEQGVGCHLDDSNSIYVLNGVRFTDITTQKWVQVDDAYQAGHVYELEFTLYAEDGYSFFDDNRGLATAFTVNGQVPSSVSRYNRNYPTRITVACLFYVPSDGRAFPVSFTGFMPYDGGLFYVSGGEVVRSANGVVPDPNNFGVWYFCAEGQAQLQHTGLALYDGEWFYLENGRLDTERSGIVAYDGREFIIAAGRILSEHDGLIQDPNSMLWYYVAGGQVADYTGLAQYDGAWFYVINGRLATEYTGAVTYDGASFNVVNGQVV